MTSKRSPKFKSIADSIEDKALEVIDLRKQLEPFSPQLADAIAEAKTGKIKKLKKLVSNLEVFRVTMMFVQAWQNGDIKQMEYYGGIIRNNIMDKPKVSLDHTSEGKGLGGVVILPAVTEGSDEQG